MDLDLTEVAAVTDPSIVPVSSKDFQELGELLWQADQGEVDSEGETIKELATELKETFEGRYGPFLGNCSFKILEEGKVVAAVITTFYPQENLPLIAFTMTHPERKGQGLCQKLLKKVAQALRAEGYSKCYLAVTASNKPAIQAYKRVGFIIREATPAPE